MLENSESPKTRAVYLGEDPPSSYEQINMTRFSFEKPKNSFSETQLNPLIEKVRSDLVDGINFRLFANEDRIDQSVKIVKLPIEISADLSAQMIAEMQTLQRIGILTSLRGGRFTDLSRPLSVEARAALLEHGQALTQFLLMVEKCLLGTDFFIRTIKLDEARMSTTQSDPDIFKPNLHFDAERASIQDFPGPIYQFFANIASEPRQFRVIPISFPEIIDYLIDNGVFTEEEILAVPMQRLKDEFLSRTNLPLEEIIIEPGHLAIFDGKTFIHDAGKGCVEDLAQGNFVPTEEPDLVLTLDTTKTGFHQGNYFPEMSFLDDPGTREYWQGLQK